MAKEAKTATVHGEELVPSTDPSKPSQLEPYPTGNPPGQVAEPSAGNPDPAGRALPARTGRWRSTAAAGRGCRLAQLDRR